jgi:hypothetical protein
MAAGSTERTSGYFGDQTPSQSKKPCFPFRIQFYHLWRTPLSQPLLDQRDQSARFYFTPIATPFRYLLELFKFQLPFFHHYFKCLNLDFY